MSKLDLVARVFFGFACPMLAGVTVTNWLTLLAESAKEKPTPRRGGGSTWWHLRDFSAGNWGGIYSTTGSTAEVIVPAEWTLLSQPEFAGLVARAAGGPSTAYTFAFVGHGEGRVVFSGGAVGVTVAPQPPALKE